MSEPILELRGVTRTFTLRASPLSWSRFLGRDRDRLSAVDGVTLSVPAGCSYGLAGESGSGKTTLARMILMLDRPRSGSILFQGRDLSTLDRVGRRWFRSRVQAVFQDSTGSLNPRMRVRDIIAEPVEAHPGSPTRREVGRRVLALLAQVGLPQRAARAFPNQLSGGQRQRVAIARALILNPSLIVLDEPVSALDVSIRGQVLNLLLDVQEEYGLTYIIIAHDLALLRHVTDRLAVMHRGQVVEEGETEAVLSAPWHPYTQALRAAVPRRSQRLARPSLPSDDVLALPSSSGCRFRSRCPYAVERCRDEDPVLERQGPDRSVACLRAGELRQSSLAASG